MCVAIASIPVSWLFDHFGRLNLGLPVLNSIFVLGVVLAVKWKLRQRGWFWITMTAIVALHLLLIVYIPWTTEWMPAAAIAGILSIDLLVVFVILAVVEKLSEGSRTAENRNPSTLTTKPLRGVRLEY